MKRADHLRLWLTLGAGLAFTTAAPVMLAKEAARRPNILFILSDDQRADTIRALGNPTVQTPHLDRLASEGTSFTRAYVMGAMQGAVCVPSRAMIMSGRPLFRVRADLRGANTWPEHLRRAGYRTFITGKWHNEQESLLRSFQEGEAVFLGGMSDHTKIEVQDIAPGGRLVGKRVANRFSSELFADSAVNFLKRIDPGQPFCLYVAFTAPHDPRTPPEKYLGLYSTAKLAVPANCLPQHPFNNGDMLGRDERLLPWPRPVESVREQWAAYYGMISHMDGQIGRILGALERSGCYQDTVIVFAADNGLALGSHGLMGKQNLYEHSTRVPVIIAGPGIAKGRATTSFAYLFDLCPTICEFAGAETPPGSEGISLVPILRNKPGRPRDSIFTAYRQCQRAVRDERYKLIRYPQLNKSQLFDLQNDPDEMNDLADSPDHVALRQRMTALLTRWQQKLEDGLPLSTSQPAPLQIDLRNVPAE